MDSKLVQIGMILVSLFTATVFLVVLAVNGVFDRKEATVATDNVVNDNQVSVNEHDYSSWQYDESFFDQPQKESSEDAGEKKEAVSVKISSIDKDIRIVMLDSEGKVIKNKFFKTEVEGLGQYNDSDRDGVIYLEDVSPGEYNITIKEVSGYSVPKKPVKVTVKSNIEYKAVADISYLIKTEEEIDAAKEDTVTKDADEESSGNSAIKTVEGAVFGIDVSKYNGEIDWKKVKEQGVKFAIIRCGYRGSKTGVIVEDPYYRKNIEGAIKEEIPVGVYFFTQAMDEKEAVEEASAVLSLTKGYKLTYPIFIDSESVGGKGRADDIDVLTRSNVLQAFCETIRSGNSKAGVYASRNWFNNRLDISKMSADNVTWLAEYADEPNYGGTYQLWQYSSAGRIPGIEGRVDMNISYLDVGIETEEAGEKERITSKENDEDGQDKSRDM